jgi:hypothetical protein
MQLAEHQHDNDQVEAWRLQILIDTGYTRARAEDLAENTTVDLHLAVSLLERGCPQPLALKILL